MDGIGDFRCPVVHWRMQSQELKLGTQIKRASYSEDGGTYD